MDGLVKQIKLLPSFTQSNGSPGKITSQAGNTRSSLTVIYVGDPCNFRYPSPTIHNLHIYTLTRGLFKTIYLYCCTLSGEHGTLNNSALPKRILLQMSQTNGALKLCDQIAPTAKTEC